MTTWGAPLTGAQMRLLQLREGEKYLHLGPFTHTWGELERGFDDGWEDFEDGSYCLPADHIAYTLASAGWLDGRNVALWFGGDKSPDDWDGGDALVNDTHPRIVKGGAIDQHNWSGNKQRAKIIAYTRKIDFSEPPVDDNQSNLMAADDKQTVTIAKMTEAEAAEFHGENACLKPYEVLQALGLIKPEPTREDRFWSSQPNGGAHVTEDIKAWVREALNFDLEPKYP